MYSYVFRVISCIGFLLYSVLSVEAGRRGDEEQPLLSAISTPISVTPASSHYATASSTPLSQSLDTTHTTARGNITTQNLTPHKQEEADIEGQQTCVAEKGTSITLPIRTQSMADLLEVEHIDGTAFGSTLTLVTCAISLAIAECSKSLDDCAPIARFGIVMLPPTIVMSITWAGRLVRGKWPRWTPFQSS